MDGESQTTLATLSYFSSPTGLALDRNTSRLYWVDNVDYELWYLDLTTRQKKLLLENLRSPVGLTMYRNDLYWSSEGSGKWTGGIYKTTPASDTTVTKVVGFLHRPTGIYAHDASAVAGKYLQNASARVS